MGTGRSRDAYVSPDDANACRGAHVMIGVLYKDLVLPYQFETVSYLLYVLENETSLRS